MRYGQTLLGVCFGVGSPGHHPRNLSVYHGSRLGLLIDSALQICQRARVLSGMRRFLPMQNRAASQNRLGAVFPAWSRVRHHQAGVRHSRLFCDVRHKISVLGAHAYGARILVLDEASHS